MIAHDFSSKPSVHRFALLACAFLGLLAAVLVAIAFLSTPSAHADWNLKSAKLTVGSGSSAKTYDILKQVVTLDKNSADSVVFEIEDGGPTPTTREIYKVDAKGNETRLASSYDTKHSVRIKDMADAKKIILKAWTKAGGRSQDIYSKEVNIRFTDTKKAESVTVPDGSQGNQSNWSFTNGLSYTFRNTGFKFIDGSTFTLNAIKLPLTFKHLDDGTTIAGINCSPEDKDFYEAIKNGNVWQKYSKEGVAEKIAKADKGWSGKGLGAWGGKSADWNICGYLSYNSSNPKAPKSLNLIISYGVKADGHAQYLCFTGTLTISVGGRAMLSGKLTPLDDGGSKVSGKFGLGAYAGAELYIGIGLNYVASVGAFGKGSFNIDFEILPDFGVDQIYFDGSFGAKAKVFGFTVATWTILAGKKPIYNKNGKKAPALQDVDPSASTASANSAPSNTSPDGTATSIASVDANTPYPTDSREYLNSQDTDTNLSAAASDENGAQAATDQPGAVLMAQDANLSVAEQDAGVIRKNTYGETELAIADTNSGSVMTYIMDAANVPELEQRDDLNRSALVYSRRQADGTWSQPILIDTSESKNFADYSPSITSDGTNCYVSWLAADSKINEGATLADVGKKVDVKVATIGPNDATPGNVTVEMVKETSDDTSTIPASPKAVKTNDVLYVGWHTNQTTGSSSEILGMAGEHKIELYKKSGSGWVEHQSKTTGAGAITSFDVGVLGGKPVCAFSLDTKYKANAEADTLGIIDAIKNSTVYVMGADSSASFKEIAKNSTNAQFATKSNASVLTYAKWIAADSNGVPYLSIMSKNATNAGEVTELDGKAVELPTSSYIIAGDLATPGKCNVSYLCSANGTTDISALVHKGAGNKDWTASLGATDIDEVVMDYRATYANDKPLFVYAADEPSSGDALQAMDDDDGGVDLCQTTDDSLAHFDVTDVSYDEFAFDSGNEMPVTVSFTNDGMAGIDGVDIYVLEGDNPIKVATVDSSFAAGEQGEATFTYTLPDGKISKAQDLVVYAAPMDSEVKAADIKRSKDQDSAFEVGGSRLVLEAEHFVVDGQESVKATVKNVGQASQGAKLVFEQSMTGDDLVTVDVPALGENETFEYTYEAPKKFFRKSGVEDMTIMLENDGGEAYSLNNTDYVTTWDNGDDTVLMYRLYNPNSGEHFYTAEIAERDNLVGYGWQSEGVGWTAPASSDTPVYRLYNAIGGEHHYTMDASERDALIAAGWNDEGTGWYSDDAKTVPLYREYNPNQFSCNHNYTTSKDEHDWLVSLGWRDEGTAWYGISE